MARSRFVRNLSEWLRQSSGAVAVYMAVMLPVLIGAVGMSIDVAQSYLVHERLSRGIDAAALAVAGTADLDEAGMLERVNSFMEANYPEEKIGVAYNISVRTSGDDVMVAASADYNTFFLHILGHDKITVAARATVRKQIKGVEAVLVLDNTGSMGTTNMNALKTAARTFVNIMFAEASRPEDVKIGLVPFANSVRVGLYGLGLVPDPATGANTGTAYNNGETFVTGVALANYTTNRSSSSGWYGCVIEHNSSGWDLQNSSNDPYPADVEDEYEGPWEIYRYGDLSTGSCIRTENRCTQTTQQCVRDHQECSSYRSDGTCRRWRTVCDEYQTVCTRNQNVCVEYNYSFTSGSVPNTGCPTAGVLPLSSAQDTILAAINAMNSHGNTQGNAGMIWGYRMISPEPPFTEAAAWNSDFWNKAVIMMTDGDNTMDSNYSYLWLTDRNDITAHPTASTTDPASLDERMEGVCNALRRADVLVYTIVFTSDVSEDTKAIYRRCATTDRMYFYAPTTAELQDVFEQIANELSNLHIRE